MIVKRTWFTKRAAAISCDRCGTTEHPGSFWYGFCRACTVIAPTEVRRDTLAPLDRSLLEGVVDAVVCSRCRASVGTSELSIECVRCRSVHPDESHRRIFDIGETPRETPIFGHCVACNGIRRKRLNDDGSIEFTYYTVGSAQPHTTPPICPRKVVGNAPSDCSHHWITLYSTVKDPGVAHTLRRQLASSPIIHAMISNDPEIVASEIEHMAQGELYFWCKDCGSHYRLTPTEVHRLPTRGLLELQ
jgi:Zn finger protein HypA/HybF involved in hydrogenase expression